MRKNSSLSNPALTVFRECSSVEEFRLRLSAFDAGRFSAGDFSEMIDEAYYNPRLVEVLADIVSHTDLLDAALAEQSYCFDFFIAVSTGAEVNKTAYAHFPALETLSRVNLSCGWKNSNMYSDSEKMNFDAALGRLLSAVTQKVAMAGNERIPSVANAMRKASLA